MKIFVSSLFALVLMTIVSGGLKADQDAVPVKVTFRKSLTSNNALVVQFSNTTDKPLAVHAAFQRATSDVRKTFALTLPPNGWKEIGRTQGWTGRSGDKITVSADGYSEDHCHIP